MGRRFARAVSDLAFVNPFLPERTEAERRALGQAFDEASANWQLAPDPYAERPNVARIVHAVELVVRDLRNHLEQGARVNDDDLQLYEDLVLFHLYHRHNGELAELVTQAVSGGPARPVVGFYTRFEEEAQHLLHPPGVTLPGGHEPEHLFAFLFQINRAFQLIFGYLVGSSPAAIRLRASIWQSTFTHDMRRYLRSLYGKLNDVSTLITGPSGTGKELVARAIGHAVYIPFDRQSRRFTHSFVELFQPLNLSALSPTLLESELFGHRKGAFTGALDDHTGWFEASRDLGAVFLDEIGDTNLEIQVKLLRVLETRTFQRLGETTPRRFQGRVLCATNRDLPAEIRAGRFREDFFYRICSDRILTPSLADQLRGTEGERRHLVQFIAQRMLPEESERLAAEVETFIDEHLGDEYPWPGNFRELEQCVRNVLIRGEYHPSGSPEEQGALDAFTSALRAGRLSAEEVLTHYATLVYANEGSYEAASRRLGLDRRTVKAKVDTDFLETLRG